MPLLLGSERHVLHARGQWRGLALSGMIKESMVWILEATQSVMGTAEDVTIVLLAEDVIKIVLLPFSSFNF